MLLLTGLTLAGSLSSRTTPTPAAPEPVVPPEPRTLSAPQPKPQRAIVTPVDSPTAPKTTLYRLPEKEPTKSPVPSPALRIRLEEKLEVTIEPHVVEVLDPAKFINMILDHMKQRRD